MTRITKDELSNLVMEAYAEGACDSMDIFLYASYQVPITYAEIEKETSEIFGHLNISRGAPHWARIH
jgi:hypothetical protein